MTLEQSLRRFVEFIENAGVWVLESEGMPECGLSRERRRNDVSGRLPPLLKRLPTFPCRVCSVCRHFPTIGKKSDFPPPFKPPGGFGEGT